MRFVCLLFVYLYVFVRTNGYKIDFERGGNRIHLESAEVRNGKVVNEPRVEEAIKTLSSLKLNNKDKDSQKNANHNKNKFDLNDVMSGNLESVENSRIFITNINKNINTNDEDIVMNPEGEHSREKVGVSGPGYAHIVQPAKTYAKPLKATRLLSNATTTTTSTSKSLTKSSSENVNVKLNDSKASTTANETSKATSSTSDEKDRTAAVALTANLTKILPELVDNPLRFTVLNSTDLD